MPLFAYLLIAFAGVAGSLSSAEINDVPVSYGGRYRPFEAYARLWLSEAYGRSSLRDEDLASFGQTDPSAALLVLRLHFLGVSDAQKELLPTMQQLPELRMLPAKRQPAEWLPLSELRSRAGQGNFTAFRDEDFDALAHAYATARIDQLEPLATALMTAYTPFAGKTVHDSPAGPLAFPTVRQLRLEVLYYRMPLVPVTIAFYLVGLILLLVGARLQNRNWTGGAIGCLALGWLVHTAILALRCYILARPPVSNMFETLVFVPWIAMGVSLVWHRVAMSGQRTLLATAAITATLLLALLQITQLNSSLENVQAVLNSHYWLIIHVLMVVSSYGVFILCGLLGHWYLIREVRRQSSPRLGDTILYSMYLGTALLIPGTILGGVWAAQSWGRFWDWDPKESWAFITSCIYLIVIHAYRFHHIGHRGLAMGAVLGLLAVSFTWYGVNYILGAGLHSYGFGSGGEGFYYLYVAFELVFVGVCYCVAQWTPRQA